MFFVRFSAWRSASSWEWFYSFMVTRKRSNRGWPFTKKRYMPNSPTNELTHRGWTYPVQNFVGAFNYERWPYGYGIGTTALGGQYVARFFNVKPPVIGVESGYGTLVVEMGIMGLILWLFLSVAIMASVWKVVKKLKGTPWFPLGIRNFLVLLLFAGTSHLRGHVCLRRFSLECLFLAAPGDPLPFAYPRAFGSVRTQCFSNPTFAPLDTLTCGSRLCRLSSTAGMARNVRLRN